MTRDEANALVETFGRRRGVFGAYLNQHDVAGFTWEGGSVWFEHIPDAQNPSRGQLRVAATVHKFRREVRMDYFDALKQEEATGRHDMGGGVLEYDPVSKGIFVTRRYVEVPPDGEAFCDDLERLGAAGNEWFYQIYNEVIHPIMRAERGE